MAEYGPEPSATSTVPADGPISEQLMPRVYRAPPSIEPDFNARDTDSSTGRPQKWPPVGRPYVQHLTSLPQPRSSFRTLQAWEGVVTGVEAQSFSVKLVDLSGDEPDEEAEIDFEEVSVDERSLIAVGAVFLLHVGYATSEGGQRSRTSILRFRRLPVWTEAELSTARRVAQEQAETIRWT